MKSNCIYHTPALLIYGLLLTGTNIMQCADRHVPLIYNPCFNQSPIYNYHIYPIVAPLPTLLPSPSNKHNYEESSCLDFFHQDRESEGITTTVPTTFDDIFQQQLQHFRLSPSASPEDFQKYYAAFIGTLRNNTIPFVPTMLSHALSQLIRGTKQILNKDTLFCIIQECPKSCLTPLRTNKDRYIIFAQQHGICLICFSNLNQKECKQQHIATCLKRTTKCILCPEHRVWETNRNLSLHMHSEHVKSLNDASQIVVSFCALLAARLPYDLRTKLIPCLRLQQSSLHHIPIPPTQSRKRKHTPDQPLSGEHSHQAVIPISISPQDFQKYSTLLADNKDKIIPLVPTIFIKALSQPPDTPCCIIQNCQHHCLIPTNRNRTNKVRYTRFTKNHHFCLICWQKVAEEIHTDHIEACLQKTISCHACAHTAPHYATVWPHLNAAHSLPELQASMSALLAARLSPALHAQLIPELRWKKPPMTIEAVE